MAVARPPIDSAAWDAHQTEVGDRVHAETTAALDAGVRAQEAQEAATAADRQREADDLFAQAVAPHEQAQRTASLSQQASDLFQQATAPLRQAMAQPRTPFTPRPSAPAGASTDEATALGRVYQDARASGLDEEGARAAMAVAKTESGYGGAVGDTDRAALGSRGTFQLFFGGGMGDEYARQRGISPDQAAQELSADPHAANRWALGGYLGQAIRAGQQQGLTGADLATYAQANGQRSVSPERAGANYQAVAGLPTTGPAPAAPAMPGGRAEAVGQFEQGLDYAEAAAICGPVAALAFVQANGRNPSLAEVRAMAVRRGWTQAGGMNGIANEQGLLQDLGVPSRLDTNPDFGEVAADAASGNPVIVSTPVHYYYANAYDPATGRLFVGKTGTSRRGGGSWMTPQQIADLDGGINGVLYVDNPQSPQPSVAASSGDTSGERPPSEFEAPSADTLVRRPLSPAAAPIAGALLRGVPGGALLDPATVVGAPYAAGQFLLGLTEEQRRNERVFQEASARANDPSASPEERRDAFGQATEAGQAIYMAMSGEPLASGAGRAAAAAGPGLGSAVRRFFHGTGSAFDRPDAARFDPNGLFGPGYYLTSDPRVAGSYAHEGRTATDFADDIAYAERQIAVARERLAPGSGAGADERAFYEAKLPEFEADLERIAGRRPNIRAVDVPAGLNLLDMDTPPSPADLERMASVLRSRYGPARAQSFLDDAELAARSRTPWTAQDATDALMRHTDRDVGDTWADLNLLLAEAGFDGLTHRGGQRVPMRDDAGNPIAHDVNVIFPEAMDKLRNAISGTAGGITAPDVLGGIGRAVGRVAPENVAGAVAGGVAGYEAGDESESLPVRAGRVVGGALLGAAGVRAVSAALRGRGAGLETGIGRRLGIAEGERVAGEGGAEVERLRLDKEPAAVRDVIQQAAEQGDFWLQQRRNVISDAEAQKMADELGRTVEQWVAGGRAGRAYNEEETIALRNAVVGQAIKVDDLKATVEALGDAASDGLRRELGAAQSTLLALSRIKEGARAEAGRTFRAYLMDTRGRLARARGPEYTSVSRVPTTAAPELEGRVVQPGFEGPPEHRLGVGDPGPVAPEVGRGAEQGTLLDPYAYYPGPRDPGPVPPELAGRVVQPGLEGPPRHVLGTMDVPPQTPAPPSATPRLTEQAPLITEPVATSGRATNLLGETRIVGAGGGSTARRIYDRASLVRLAGMVSGVPGQLLNLGGNVVMGGTTLALKEGQVAADIARVGIGRTAARVGVGPARWRDLERQRFQAEVGPQIAGYARGWWAGAQQIPAILRGDLPQDFLRATEARRFASGSAAADTVVEAPLRALAASDAVFRSAAFGGHAAALATRKATQEGLSGAARTRRVQEILGNLSDHPDILDNANHLAARDVFQEGRLETDAIARLKQQNTAARVAGDVVLPFYKTPYNVAAQGAGMTPAGYLGALAAARRGETGEAVDRAVRATVGTMAVGVGLQLAQSNLLTGAYPADEATRSTLPEGWKPYSLRIPSGDGAVYVPIQAFGAWAVPLGTAAIVKDAQDRGARKDDLLTSVYAGLGGIGQFMGDMSALQGLNSIFKLVTEPERSVERTAESFAASLVPYSGLARQVQQALGDAQRDPQNPVQAFMAAVPGLSQFVPEQQTALGDARRRGPSGWRALVTGGRVGVEQDEPVLAAYREAGASLSPPGTSVLGHALTPEEQRRVQARAGQLLRERVTDWQTDPEFRALPPDERKDILDRARTRARQDAGVEVLDALSDDELARRRAQATLKRPA